MSRGAKTKERTTITLPIGLSDKARGMGIVISHVCTEALNKKIQEKKP